MADVFISYARKDQALARRVATKLEMQGLAVWWDDQLPAHRAYSEIIEQRLREAKAVVVLWSAEAVQSQWVRAEADVARTEGKLVQARTDGAVPPLPFNQVQCADLKGWRGSAAHEGWRRLNEGVAVLVSGNGDDRPADTAVRRPAWQRPRMLAAAALGLLLIAAAAWLLYPRLFGGGPAERPVLAVLPFKSLDARDESLVAGIWEDTRQAIGRNPQLLVLGPNTSEQLAEKPETAQRAADYLVEASVRSSGDRVRVSANLVRTDDNAQVWSETFERRLDDVFRLQQEVAGAIEGRIRGRLATRGGIQPEHISTTGEVYALYSDARAKIRSRHFQAYPEAKDQLERVTRLDPNFAPGWATLSILHKMAVGSPIIKGTTNESAEVMARRSIALAPNLAAGHAALGFALEKGAAAQASLRRAVALDPNDIEALNWLANSLDRSEAKEKLRLYSKIVEIEPLWWPAIFNRTKLLYEMGDTAALEQEITRLDSLGNVALASVVRMELMAKRGDLSGIASLGLERYRQAGEAERSLLGIHLFGALLQLGHFELADKIFPPPSRWVPYIRKNDPKALDLIENEKSPEQFWTFGPLPVVSGRVYLMNDQGPRMARRYKQAASSPREFEELVGPEALVDIVPSLALALRSAGEEAEARELLGRAEAAAKTESPNLERDVALARIYAAAGRKEEAMGLLSAAVRRGWLPPYMPIHTDIALDPPLAEMREDPRFEALRQQILRTIAKERAELGPVDASKFSAASRAR